jgi:ABC-type phosphate transport system substrate-binding protein
MPLAAALGEGFRSTTGTQSLKALATTVAFAGVIAATSLLLVAPLSPAIAMEISGAGATFPYPLYTKWADAYKKDTGTIVIYQPIGSAGGIKQIQNKTVTFGASDMPFKLDQLKKDGLMDPQWLCFDPG